MTQAGRQKIGIGFVILGLLIIFIIIYFSFIKKTTDPENLIIDEGDKIPVVDEDVNTTPSDIPRDNKVYDISKEEEHIFNSSDLEKRSKFFTERFGTYSNQSDYSNFTELEIFMTKSFSDWTKVYASKLKENAPDHSSYYGISTRSLTAKVLDFNSSKGTAEIHILTERTETLGDLQPESYQEGITLKFVKLSKDWLVDAAYWDKK